MRRIVAPLVVLCVAFVAGCANSSDLSSQALLTGATGSEGSAKIRASAASSGDVSDGKATETASLLMSSVVPGASTYKIGPQDVLEISVFKVPELSKSVQVADTGTVNLPLVGDIKASGRTAQDVERDLVGKLGSKYLHNPQVSVFVKEYNSQRITVEGAVKKPGVFPYRGRATLLQAIAMAEGLDNAVAETNVVVFRNVKGKRAAAKFDIEDIRRGRAEDPQIESGDVVIVANSAMKETFNSVLKVLPLAGLFALL